jgi:hypothetical protein
VLPDALLIAMSHTAIFIVALAVIVAFIVLMVFLLGYRAPSENKRR